MKLPGSAGSDFTITVHGKNAEIDAEVWIVETADRARKIATITVSNRPGRMFGSYDYDTASGITEA